MLVIKNRIVFYEEGGFYLILIPPKKGTSRYWRLIMFEVDDPRLSKPPFVLTITARQAVGPFLRFARRLGFTVTREDRAALRKWARNG